MSTGSRSAAFRGPATTAGMLVWLLVVGTATAISAVGLGRGVADPDSLQTPQVGEVLASLGLPLRGSIVVALVVPLVVTTAAAGLVFVKRGRDPMALLFSAAMVCLQTFTSVGNISLLQQGGVARASTLFILWIAMPAVIAVLYLFPDGRFHPRWTRPALVSFVFASLLLRGTPERMMGLIRPGYQLDLPGRIGVMLVGMGVVSGMYAQFRRFRDVSTVIERQQAKWVTFPLGLAFAYMLVAMVLPAVFVDLPDAWLGWVMVAAIPLGILFPICIAIALLKYRLYDIDLVISRTVVFAGLAGFITAIYVGIVVGIGTLLGAGEEPNLALSVVATAVVAVAFQPARQRLTRIANRLVFGHRATPYEVLSSFAEQLGETTTPTGSLERMAKLVADGTGADRVLVWLRIGARVKAIAVWPEVLQLDPPADRDLSTEEAFADFDHVEQIAHEGEQLGAITLNEPRGEVLNHTEQELLRDLAGQAALVLRNLRLTEELRAHIEELHRSRRRMLRAQDDERQRLERDLHDGAQQQLARLTRAISGAAAAAEAEGAAKAAELLTQVADDGEGAIQAVRELAHGIYPPLLATEGLTSAITTAAGRAAVPVTVEADGIGHYSQDVEAAVYFCVLEAITNAAKYADPTQVTIRLAETDAQLTFEVSDNGTGFDPDTTARGHGTTNMTDRLDALNGHITIDSRPGAGTAVRGSLPVRAEVPA